MLLCNLSRSETHLNECVKSIAPHLLQIMEAFTNTRHSRVGAKYHYIGIHIINVTQSTMQSNNYVVLCVWYNNEK